MSREQGPRETGMRPAAIAAGLRQCGAWFDGTVMEEA
jgi:hypothetical protein